MGTSDPLDRPAHARRPARRFAAWLAGACCLLSAQACLAGSLQVAPISLEFSEGEQAEALWLSNAGTTPIRAQVRVMRWQQEGGAEQLDPSRDLVPSPPIVEIAPGQQQLVRIVRPAAAPASRELAYRVVVDELPDAQQQAAAGLQFLLQYSIPVFVLPPGTVARDAPGARPPTDASTLSANVAGDGADGRLTIANPGAQRVRVSQLALVDASGTETMLVPGLLGYVLAGQRMQWPVSLPAGGLRGARLRARLNDDQDPQILPLASPTP